MPNPGALYLKSAAIVLAKSPPDNALALAYLDKAEKCDPENPAVHILIGRTYRSFTANAQHLLLASKAFVKALRLTGWPANLMNEWCGFLGELVPREILDLTLPIPKSSWTAALYAIRARSCGTLDLLTEAWEECAEGFERFGFDKALFEAAHEVARKYEPLKLLSWKSKNENRPGLKALMAVVWERNGNQAMAAQMLAQAIAEAR